MPRNHLAPNLPVFRELQPRRPDPGSGAGRCRGWSEPRGTLAFRPAPGEMRRWLRRPARSLAIQSPIAAQPLDPRRAVSPEGCKEGDVLHPKAIEMRPRVPSESQHTCGDARVAVLRRLLLSP